MEGAAQALPRPVAQPAVGHIQAHPGGAQPPAQITPQKGQGKGQGSLTEPGFKSQLYILIGV